MVETDGLIFVALVVAWAVYLIPKALSHHEESVRSRSVDRFSDSMRVLARREPVDRRNARLVVQPGRGAAAPVVTSKGPGPSPAEIRARRAAARRAAGRRRNVLLTLVLVTATVAVLAGVGLFSWWYVALPGALVVGWLTLCRVMVRRERGMVRPGAAPLLADEGVAAAGAVEASQPVHPEDFDVVRNEQGFDEVAATATTSVLSGVGVPANADPNLWDPLPLTLPTYVSAPEAPSRTVRSIDLDSTGVWSSGRNAADSALAREAEQEEARQARQARQAERDLARQRRTGS